MYNYIIIDFVIIVPLQVTGIYVRTVDDIVEWLPTSSIHGDIISYEIQLFSSEEDGEINEVDGTITLYEVNVTSDFPMAGQPVNVRVRQRTCEYTVSIIYRQSSMTEQCV